MACCSKPNRENHSPYFLDRHRIPYFLMMSNPKLSVSNSHFEILNYVSTYFDTDLLHFPFNVFSRACLCPLALVCTRPTSRNPRESNHRWSNLDCVQVKIVHNHSLRGSRPEINLSLKIFMKILYYCIGCRGRCTILHEAYILYVSRLLWRCWNKFVFENARDIPWDWTHIGEDMAHQTVNFSLCNDLFLI